jgi:hypothetical protein
MSLFNDILSSSKDLYSSVKPNAKHSNSTDSSLDVDEVSKEFLGKLSHLQSEIKLPDTVSVPAPAPKSEEISDEKTEKDDVKKIMESYQNDVEKETDDKKEDKETKPEKKSKKDKIKHVKKEKHEDTEEQDDKSDKEDEKAD